jgi:hypothetical protein
MTHNFDRYGEPSIKMLKFLYHNPASSSREITDHLFDGKKIKQSKIRYTYQGFDKEWASHTLWTGGEDWFLSTERTGYKEVEVLDRRTILLSKVCRGKFAYLLSPYCSRTLAAGPTGAAAHPGVANRNAQRRWFYREKGSNSHYLYFLTIRGMAAFGALMEHENNAA